MLYCFTHRYERETAVATTRKSFAVTDWVLPEPLPLGTCRVMCNGSAQRAARAVRSPPRSTNLQHDRADKDSIYRRGTAPASSRPQVTTPSQICDGILNAVVGHFDRSPAGARSLSCARVAGPITLRHQRATAGAFATTALQRTCLRSNDQPVKTIRIKSAVLRAPSFSMTRARCTSTVRGEIPSSRPASLFD